MKRTLMLLLVATGAAFTAGPVSAAQSVSQTLSFGTGWTLSGNGLKKALPVTALLGTKESPITGVSDVVVTVWQWDGTNSKWLFFAPSLSAAEIDSYAQSKGYGVHFSRFGAAFDPTSLDGYYGYGWQAGKGDNYARIFAVSIDGSTQDGTAWFGFGEDIAVSDGSIKGFFCNWAGPGNIKNPMPQYAQRQTIKLNTALTPGKWQAQVSNIRYAPTNTCTYTGSGFWYDRDLNQANNESATDINVTGSETDFLYQKGAADATITDTIKATGMTFPAF